MTISLDPTTTALVMIDLQRGILGMDLAPYDSATILQKSLSLAERFRKAGGLVVPVHVAFGKNGRDAPCGLSDVGGRAALRQLPADWAEFAEGVVQEEDLVILKQQWGAFTGTKLDSSLRRRGIKTIVLTGIATNFGVESTARFAWELGYNVVIVEDSCTSFGKEVHDMAVNVVFPRIARVVTSDNLTLDA